jgi:hypothetical protein
MARQRYFDFKVFEDLAFEEPVHLVDGGDDAVRADHLDRTRSLKPRDASWAVVNEDLVALENGSGGVLRPLFRRQSRFE